MQGGREGDDQRVDGDGQGSPGVLGEEGQPEKKARQDAAAASSEESAKEAVPMEEDRGIKRNEDDWTEFAMSLKKKAKQGPGEGEMELSAMDVVNWVNAVLEEGEEEEEKAWE